MKKWRVYAVVQGSKYVGTFEAKSAKQAEEKAWESSGAHVSFCHHCSSEWPRGSAPRGALTGGWRRPSRRMRHFTQDVVGRLRAAVDSPIP